MKTFATILTCLRVHAGLSMYRLGQLSGVTKEAIAKLERPGSNPKLNTITKLAQGLGVPTWELLPDWPGATAKQAVAKKRSK
jgi:transcriptional regulator with XRE-family HTH domain